MYKSYTLVLLLLQHYLLHIINSNLRLEQPQSLPCQARPQFSPPKYKLLKDCLMYWLWNLLLTNKTRFVKVENRNVENTDTKKSLSQAFLPQSFFSSLYQKIVFDFHLICQELKHVQLTSFEVHESQLCVN